MVRYIYLLSLPIALHTFSVVNPLAFISLFMLFFIIPIILVIFMVFYTCTFS
nr:MAG TPA: hypothetical protein [Caudoviricetes sp.]